MACTFDLATILTPIAAVALALVMLLAAIKHFQMNDAKGSVPSLVLMVLSIVVAVGRCRSFLRAVRATVGSLGSRPSVMPRTSVN